jgi:hypothetical protein
MTTKEQIIQELDHVPESELDKVLAIVQRLKVQAPGTQVPDGAHPEVWAAYLESEREREEVYRRLANS